jgi:hypothetical protein
MQIAGSLWLAWSRQRRAMLAACLPLPRNRPRTLEIANSAPVASQERAATGGSACANKASLFVCGPVIAKLPGLLLFRQIAER